MATKKYISNSSVSISVTLEEGHSTHIAFSPLTGKGSVFYTDNTKIQKALESHSYYGKLFKSAPMEEEKPQKAKAKGNKSEYPKELNGDNKKEITVKNLDEAKEYLCEQFSYSRTKLKNKEIVETAAAEHGIVFIGI